MLKRILITSFFLYAQVVYSASQGWTVDSKAKIYHRTNELQRLWFEYALSKVSLQSQARILDFGSGDGRNSASLALRLPQGRVFGADLSPAMVRFSQLKYEFDNLTFSHVSAPDFSNHSFLSESFDWIVSFCVMHLVNHPVETLKNLNKVLKPQGRVLLTYPVTNREFMTAMIAALKKNNLPLLGNTMVTQLTMRVESDARKVLALSGFEILDFEHIKQRSRFVDDEDFVQWGKGTLSQNFHVSQDKEDQLYQDFITEYQKIDTQARNELGGFSHFLERFVIIAQKRTLSL
jgi:2-polyprenyl-3-methyl-5-hydroxy-6-metoxy-1,4-benzoquinol methylase